MKTISDQIRIALSTAIPEFNKVSLVEARRKPAPDVWSKSEILGHLIDSTTNNHQRVVRAAQNAAMDFPPYDQDRWVEVQPFNEMDWLDLVNLFNMYSLHLCMIIEKLPPEVFNNPCNTGAEEPVPLQAVVEGYLRHINHHINQILEKPDI